MTHLGLELFTPFEKPTYSTIHQIISFLEQENTSKNKEDICKALEYSIKERSSHGGFVLLLRKGLKINAVAILNQTGLEGVMPKYILSHFAVNMTSNNAVEIHDLLTKKILKLTNGEVACLESINSKGGNIGCQRVSMLSTVVPNNDSEKDCPPHLCQVEVI